MSGYVEKSTICCGLAEYHGLNEHWTNAKEVLCTIANAASKFERGYGDSFCHVMLTQIGGSNYRRMSAVRRIVEQEGLGQWVQTRPSTNPNSGNMVKAAWFTPNKRALLAYVRAEEPARMRREREEQERWDRMDRW